LKIEGSYRIPAPRERVFPLLVDEQVLCRCVPGCRRLERQTEDRFSATLDVGVGSVKGTYEGTVTLSQRVPPDRLEMQVEGQGRLGFVRGKGSLVLENAPDGDSPITRVLYQGDVQVGGSLASVGQRMVQSASKMMAGQFFAALEAEVKARLEPQPQPVRHSPVRSLFRWLRALVRDLLHRARSQRTTKLKSEGN
jgi:carbon monoxide dehydrogenase subunit G